MSTTPVAPSADTLLDTVKSVPTDRRRFLKRLALGSAGVAAAPLLPTEWSQAQAAAVPAKLIPAPLQPDEAYWELVRAQFLFRPGHVALNAANLGPSPREVVEARVEAGRKIDADQSGANRAEYGTTHNQVRERMAAYLGVTADEVAIVRNTSEANNTIVNGLTLKAGDEVLLWDQNHPTNNVAWDVRAGRFGFTVKRFTTPAAPTSRRELLDLVVGSITPATKVVSITDVSNTTGIRMPSREICAACRERGIYIHVDGAQTFGADALDLKAMGCDSYSGSAHKWFMGPKEAGILYVRAERVSEIWPLIVATGWGNASQTTPARKFESLGQRDDAVWPALAATLDFHERIGKTVVQARITELSTQLKQGLTALGATLVTPASPELSGGVVISRIEGINLGQVNTRIYANHGIAGASTGGLRLCPHVYTTRADIARTVESVGKVVAEMRG
jgi:selenocysteine lyase/cysteine desulfurase